MKKLILIFVLCLLLLVVSCIKYNDPYSSRCNSDDNSCSEKTFTLNIKTEKRCIEGHYYILTSKGGIAPVLDKSNHIPISCD